MLKKGDKFKQAWRSCKNPIVFEVLEVDRERDYLKVNCISSDGYSHEEEWQGPGDGLEFTEGVIEMGEYEMIE